jgi:hypothetical protein
MRARATAAAQAASTHTAHAAVRRATSARDGLLALKLERGQVRRQKHGKDTAPCLSNAGLQHAQPHGVRSSSSSVHAVGRSARSNLWLRSPSSAIATMRAAISGCHEKNIKKRTSACNFLLFSQLLVYTQAPMFPEIARARRRPWHAARSAMRVHSRTFHCPGMLERPLLRILVSLLGLQRAFASCFCPARLHFVASSLANG